MFGCVFCKALLDTTQTAIVPTPPVPTGPEEPLLGSPGPEKQAPSRTLLRGVGEVGAQTRSLQSPCVLRTRFEKHGVGGYLLGGAGPY